LQNVVKEFKYVKTLTCEKSDVVCDVFEFVAYE